MNLKEYLASRTDFSDEELLDLVRQIAEALEESQGPVTPQSLIVQEGKVEVVHHTDLSLQEAPFVAPEQKERGTHLCADAYTFGALLYYLVMRHPPEGYFPPLSDKLPHSKKHWGELVRDCLQYEKSKRPPSIQEALLRLLNHTPQPILRPEKIVRPEYDQDPGAIFQRETTIARYAPKQESEQEIAPLLTEMCLIPAGSFSRGSNHGGRDEMPVHMITLSAYALDEHPVTNEQYVRFLEAMGGEKDGNNSDMIRLRESRIKRLAGRLNIESGYAKHPVVGVTWYGAHAYARWVGKRLPTEAEWEVAARGGCEDGLYPTGSNIERPQANFFSSDTTAVMSYPANGYGLFDMAGNVYEWCQDWYGYHYYTLSVQEPHNPKGPLQGVYRVLRGGCWKSLKEDLRCAHRHRNNPGTMNGTYGFRCAADVV